MDAKARADELRRDADKLEAAGMHDEARRFWAAADKLDAPTAPDATHTLLGRPVHSVQNADSPWRVDVERWSRGIRVDNGEPVYAPTWYFKAVQ